MEVFVLDNCSLKDAKFSGMNFPENIQRFIESVKTFVYQYDVKHRVENILE